MVVRNLCPRTDTEFVEVFFPFPFFANLLGAQVEMMDAFTEVQMETMGNSIRLCQSPIHKMKECKGICWNDKKGVR